MDETSRNTSEIIMQFHNLFRFADPAFLFAQKEDKVGKYHEKKVQGTIFRKDPWYM